MSANVVLGTISANVSRWSRPLCYLLCTNIQLPYLLFVVFLCLNILTSVDAFPAVQRRFNQTRWKRDEDPGSVYGKGIAFFLGEPCESTCNRILFHVWCNSTTHRCECLPEYPVNVDNKYCLKAARIDEPCEYSESCQYLTSHSECSSETNLCKCKSGSDPKYGDNKEIIQCVQADLPFHVRMGNTGVGLLHNMEFLTISSLTLSFILLLVLFCLVLKLINKNNQILKATNMPATCDHLPAPPPIILRHEPADFYPSIESSPQSGRHFSLTEKPKYFPTLPPTLGSRRQSFSSLPSQSSIKSVSSVRSQHSYRNLYQHDRSNHGHLSKAGVRGGHDTYRKASSPLERSSGYLPNHLPDHSNHIRAKCSNTRCGTNSKVKSEVCLVHTTTNHNLHDELFVPNN